MGMYLCIPSCIWYYSKLQMVVLAHFPFQNSSSSMFQNPIYKSHFNLTNCPWIFSNQHRVKWTQNIHFMGLENYILTWAWGESMGKVVFFVLLVGGSLTTHTWGVWIKATIKIFWWSKTIMMFNHLFEIDTTKMEACKLEAFIIPTIFCGGFKGCVCSHNDIIRWDLFVCISGLGGGWRLNIFTWL